MNKIKLKINENNLLSRLGEAFSNSTTFITEMAQNANRSKATKLEITTTENSITFADNGTGIKDFQSLLTVAESGWDIETIEKTNAFGIGFLSAIYASQRVEVHSNGYQVAFDTKDLLAGNGVEVHNNSLITTGTVIKLTGEFNLLNLNSMFSGFPLPVYINDDEVKRKNAFNETDFIETEYGHIKFANPEYSVRSDIYCVFFLQGQQVYSDSRYTYNTANVVHLDDTNFKARLPDRDKLIDEASVVEKIRASIKAHYSEQALELVKRLKVIDNDDEMRFIEDSFSFIRKWDRGLLNQLDYVLANDFIDTNTIDLVVGHSENADDNGWGYLSGLLWKKDLESKTVIIHNGSYIDEEDMDCMTFVKVSGDCYVMTTEYDTDHWINELVVGHSESCSLEVEPVNIYKTANNPSNWVYVYHNNKKGFDTTFCEATKLSLIMHTDAGAEEVAHTTNNKISIYSQRMGEFFIVDEDNTSSVLLSAVGFYSEYNHEEYEENEELDTFLSFIRRNRISSDIDLLKEIIANEISRGVIPQELLGKELTFKWDSDMNVVDLKVA
jgi:hypothetical protein